MLECFLERFNSWKVSLESSSELQWLNFILEALLQDKHALLKESQSLQQSQIEQIAHFQQRLQTLAEEASSCEKQLASSHEKIGSSSLRKYLLDLTFSIVVC